MSIDFRKLKPSSLTPSPILKPRILWPGKETERLVTQHARINEAAANVITHIVESTSKTPITFAKLANSTSAPKATESQTQPSPSPTSPTSPTSSSDSLRSESGGGAKLDRLVAHDFPFDSSQLTAISGLIQQQYACLTGAAGTGKTTVTKGLVDQLLEQGLIGEVDMASYFKRGDATNPDDEDDEYVMPEHLIPSVCLCAFTGQASQQIKKNFPSSWHANIMTIHRMLAFVPEFYEDFDSDAGELKQKMRFVPTYGPGLKLPWDIILIDEAGMQSIDLWEQVWAACTPKTRIFMVGDINQLPPVHGRSIFGFAMTNWPSWELTEIHRQIGENNSIVDNAWRILQGKTPISDAPREAKLNLLSKEGAVASLNWMIQNKDWKTLTLELPAEHKKAAKIIKQVVGILQNKFYDSIRDCIITAINGHDGSQGRELGQIPMNQELALILNHDGQRYIIDAGRERKNFGIGEKIMNTKNNHEAGITNGMTGVVASITQNAQYSGDNQRFGRVEDVSAYLNDVGEDADVEFTLDEAVELMDAQSEGKKAAKEKKDRGPASHIVTMRFGHGEHTKEIPFATLAEVASLQTAYCVTCHKMQGSEAPRVFVICHESHKQMLYREWLYTAWTRASEKIILLYTPFGLRQALNKQKIKGASLREKVLAFQKLQKDYGVGAKVNVVLPAAKEITQ